MSKKLDRKIAKEIKQQKWKEREDKKAKWVANSLNVTEKVVQKLAEKHAWTNFTSTWFVITLRKVGDKFQQNFTMGLKVHPLLYKGVNLAISTST